MSNTGRRGVRPLHPNLNDVRHLDKELVSRVVTAYTASGPYVSPRELFPQLRGWFEALPSDDPKYAVIAGSIGVEAAVGAPHTNVRRALLGQARRRLNGDHSLEGVSQPSNQLVRMNRVLGVANLLATRSLTGMDYRRGLQTSLGHLYGECQKLVDVSAYAELRTLSGFIMEQTVLCLLHRPEIGIVAVPSFLRQDENEWEVAGKKYRWDVTAESDGTTVPTGQYRIQAKNTATYVDQEAYHPDIIVIAGHHLGDNPYMGEYRKAAAALIVGDVATIADCQEALFTIMSNRGPATPELHYLEQ